MPIEELDLSQPVNTWQLALRWALFALLSIAALACVRPAAADTLVYDGPAYSPYYGTYTLHDSSPTVNVTAYAGGFAMTDTSAPGAPSFTAWCVDIYHDLDTSSSGASYMSTAGTSFYSAPKSYMTTDLDRLASYVFDNNLLTDNASSAAFQLAVWEIVDDSGGTTAYDVENGDFYATTDTSHESVLDTANTWLGVVSARTYAIDQQLSVWQKGVGVSTQNLAVFAPVPEPASSLMLVSGIGLIAFVARRRRKARDVES